MKNHHRSWSLLFAGIISVPVLGSAQGLRKEEPTEMEVRRIQTQMNMMDTRMGDPTSMEQRKIMQDQLFDKIRRLHENNRSEKDLVGGIEAQKRQKATRQESSVKTASASSVSDQTKINSSSKDEGVLATPVKVNPPQPRPAETVVPEKPASSNGNASDNSSSGTKADPSDVYRSIINYTPEKKK